MFEKLINELCQQHELSSPQNTEGSEQLMFAPAATEQLENTIRHQSLTKAAGQVFLNPRLPLPSLCPIKHAEATGWPAAWDGV